MQADVDYERLADGALALSRDVRRMAGWGWRAPMIAGILQGVAAVGAGVAIPVLLGRLLGAW